MMDILNQIIKTFFLFLVGGTAYCVAELLFRGHTHWTMLLLGGACFLLCGMANEVIPWEMPLPEQMFLCCILITAAEWAAGYILNIWLQMAIWDYSNMPFNYRGQICLPFSIAWYFLSAVAIILDDYMRYWIFKEENPHYTIRRRKC